MTCKYDGCTGLTSVDIPNSVTIINGSAFYNCTSLINVEIPESVNSIGANAFMGCSQLIQVNVPDAVTTIGNNTFSGCTSLRYVKIGKSVASVSKSAFSNCTNYTLEINSQNLVGTAYSSSQNMSTWFGAEINKVILGEDIKTIGGYAFYACKNILEVELPSSLTTIGTYAFRSCTNLAQVSLPSSVTSIGNYAFAGCTGLSNVTVSWESPLSITTYIFDGVTLANVSLRVPSGTKTKYQKAAVWKTFGKIKEEDPDNYLKSSDLETRYGTQIPLLVEMINKDEITAFQFEITVPEGVNIVECELTNRKQDHTSSFSELKAGHYQVVAISLKSKAFSGTDGDLVNIMLNIDDNMATGDYDIGIKNIELTTTTEKVVTPADCYSKLTISDVLVADTNGDGKISITDAVAIVNYILGNASTNFVHTAADVNNDGKVSITDAVAIVNMILRGNNSAKARNSEILSTMLNPQ